MLEDNLIYCIIHRQARVREVISDTLPIYASILATHLNAKPVGRRHHLSLLVPHLFLNDKAPQFTKNSFLK